LGRETLDSPDAVIAVVGAVIVVAGIVVLVVLAVAWSAGYGSCGCKCLQSGRM
jgi:hypothetical protein